MRGAGGGGAVRRAFRLVCRPLALCGREGGAGRSLGVDPGTTRCRVQPAVDLLAALAGLPPRLGTGEEAISVALPWLRVRGVVVLGVMVVVGVMVVCWCSGRDGFWSTSFCMAR